MKNIYKIFTSEKKRYALHKSHKMWVTIAISATGAIIPFLLSATPASVVSLTPVIYASTLSRTVTISPSQFGDAFQRNGVTSSYPYDTNNSIQTLTLDQHNLTGNVTLKNKIDMTQDFTLTGKINLGDKSSANQGADGIGFLLQPGNVNVYGKPGGAAGIGGVPGGFGFKFDTWNNNENTSVYTADPSPKNFTTHSYAAFVDGTSGVANTIASTAKTIADPSNNTFRNLTISYSGNNQTLTVAYDGQTWSRNISDLLNNQTNMSLAITASTGGGGRNLQQLQNMNFHYTVAQGKVITNYVDQYGNYISSAPSVTSTGDLGTTYATTPKEIPGYIYQSSSGPVSGVYTANDQIITYRYKTNDKPVIKATNQDYKVGDSIDPLKNVTASDKEDGTTKVTVAKIVDQDGKVIDSIPNDKAGKYTVTYTTTDADGNTVTKDATISVRSNEKPGNGTDNGNPSSNQPGNPSQPSNATNNGVINTSTNIGSNVNNGAVNSPELPQTGENNRQSQTMSFIGVLLAMFGSLLGFLGIKKRRND